MKNKHTNVFYFGINLIVIGFIPVLYILGAKK